MKSKASQSQGLLLFRLSQTQVFALGTLKVRELVPYTRLSKIPQSHPTILGASTIRGHTIPIIDMAAAIGYRPIAPEEREKCYIIITDCQRMIIGFLVRGIDKIIECNWRDIEAPSSSLGKNAYLTGVTRFEDQLVQLLDVELLLSKIFPDNPKANRAILTDVQREKLKPMNILLVDDSKVARKQLSDALDMINIPYRVTADGKEALVMMEQAALEHHPIDILVSDIEMPGLDGYELAFEVRDNPLTAKAYIILHTSLSSEISVSQAHQVGANEALTKFDAHELIDAMLRGADLALDKR
ncbi:MULTISPECIES: chemotaxis protein CheV [Shewanella]|jgi:two-component system, chemotaxis family, chemotaxis protein CheV|uniref:Response regulator receiver modulated CheW protein n=2 Tax=Shewanella TaxID=22 RepID=A3D6C0_SHEB5|nr:MULTISPECIES: chemotaxis protein CheV [Shewanella]ABN62283.1 response regulator receiver modulated CheW protein [Shewanella baltica OS155]ABS08950.1 putative CheW protein [Shewanella baltica OS185]ACK46066.1 response regulator receiver modulated CheW protein [Shewanella baltica OS223]AEH14628.1 response regulator receiver modulated CheW protein [Shewanella baltica OS117]AVT49028.1 chemotaxis protein CheV [Shewanella baltica]